MTSGGGGGLNIRPSRNPGAKSAHESTAAALNLARL
jgi:hypothetical protein